MTSMHSTSCQRIIPGENKLQMHGGNHKTTRPWKFSHPRKPPICRNQMHPPISAPGVVTHYMQRDFNVHLGNSNVRYATSLATSLQCVIRKVKANSHPILSTQENPRHNNFASEALYTHHDADRSESESDTEDTFCLQMKIHRTQVSHPEVPKPIYLMANLAYCLQEHHKRNQYLQARLDTCADVNLMPMVVYCLMFKDPGLKKLTPSNMEIETYTNEVVKIIGTCYFYLVHPESKQLMKVLFFVTKENGSILLSCRTTMDLGLIRPHTHLDYLPPKASLLTSTCDQPSKTKIHKPNIHYTKEKPY